MKQQFILKLILCCFLALFLEPLQSQEENLDFFSLYSLKEQILSEDNAKRIEAIKKLPTLTKKQKKEMIDLIESHLEDPKEDVRLRSLLVLENISTRKSKKLMKIYKKTHSKEGYFVKNYKFPGAQAIIKRQQKDALCYEHEKFFAFAKMGKKGQSIYITKKKDRKDLDCLKAVMDLDYALDNPWSESFFGVRYPYLFIQNETPGSGDWFTVYDIRFGKKMFSSNYSEPVRLDDNIFKFWVLEAPATLANCPKFQEYKANGIEAVIEKKAYLDIWSMTVTKDQGWRCVPAGY